MPNGSKGIAGLGALQVVGLRSLGLPVKLWLAPEIIPGCTIAGAMREMHNPAMGIRVLVVAAGLTLPALAVAADEPVTLVTPLVYGTHLPGLGTPAAALAKIG